MKRILILFSSALPIIFSLAPATPVLADIQIEISGNGADSTNSVSVGSSQNTTVEQSNTANVEQSVSQETNTGGNSVSDSSGDTQVTTGDATSQTQINNELNNSTVSSNCCGGNEINIIVSDNGAGSVNTVHTEVSQTTTVSITQVVDVTNNVGISTITGNNQVQGVSGKVLIETGDAKAGGGIENAINQTSLVVSQGAWDITIFAKDNGDDTTNVVFLDFVNNLVFNKLDESRIANNVYADVNTGGNSVLDTLNDVTIKTGDAEFEFNLSNDPVNTDKAEIICCEDGEIPPPGDGGPPGPTPSPSPGIPPADGNGYDGNGGNGGGGKAGEVLGAVTQILPITGASALHFWILAVVYLITFLIGLYVRLRAGRSPNFAFVTRPVGRPRKFRGYQLLTY